MAVGFGFDEARAAALAGEIERALKYLRIL